MTCPHPLPGTAELHSVRPRPRSRLRRALQAGFFSLFVLAPLLDVFRYDLTQGHFVVFGRPWVLDMERIAQGSPAEALELMFWRALLPVLILVGGGLWVAWRYGRLYCGWLCPHFSVLEFINGLTRRAHGRPTVWERSRGDGDRRWWPAVALGALVFAVLWAWTLLSYLLPPARLFDHLVHWTFTPGEARFLIVATVLLALEFLFFRHLFCRYACAVGLFQSLAWMGNPRALEVRFDRSRAGLCKTCAEACDQACPMRLKPRGQKRRMFTCTQCTGCIDACDGVQNGRPLLHWRSEPWRNR